MRTEIVRGPEGIEQAAHWIRQGWPVAFPTETVYGLGANAFDETAVARIFAAKGRPADNPLIVHVLGADDPAWSRLVAEPVPKEAVALWERFWPGPLTLILPARPEVPALVRAGLETVAVRAPSHPVARALIAAAGVPLAAPSANRSGRPSPTTAEHVYEDLAGRIPVIIDGGPTEAGVESTVVDVTRRPFLLLRPGATPREAIEAVVGPLGQPDAASSRRSPGTRHRHYAPRAPVSWLAEDDLPAIQAWLTQAGWSGRWGLLAPEAVVRAISAPVAFSLGADPWEAARRLYAGLRELDRAGVERILVVWSQRQGVGEAVANRLAKATGEGESAATVAPLFLLFVCSGNTCRSPMAEALWNRLQGPLRAQSAGVAAVEGLPAAAEAVRAVAPWGADLSRHRSRPLEAVEGTPLWVLTMTRAQAEAVRRRRPEWADRVRLLTEMVGEDREVADPIGQGQAAYDILATQLVGWLERLRAQLVPAAEGKTEP